MKVHFWDFLVVQWLRLDGSASGEVGLIPGQELRFYTLICAVKFSFLNTKESTLEQSHSNFSMEKTLMLGKIEGRRRRGDRG